MNNNHICVFDFETGGKNPVATKDKPACEILQIGALMLHPTKLNVVSTFESLVQPTRPELLEDEALMVNGLTRDQVMAAPHPKIVWADFVRWIKQHQKKNTVWEYPVAAGYNINNFDMPLLNGMCKEYGPTYIDRFDKSERQGVFGCIFSIDLMQVAWMMMENSDCLQGFSETGKHNLKLTTLAKWFGLKFENAHDALGDVFVTAAIIAKMLKLYRSLVGNGLDNGRVQFHNAFGGKTAEEFFDYKG